MNYFPILLLSFYAAVFRKDTTGHPENALTREQALHSITIWPAKASFEEHEKGSLEPGKWADFVILDIDLMEADEMAILQVQVLNTFIGGELVYSRE